MCGIAGFYSFQGNINRERFETMVDIIEYRGPDDRGVFYYNNLALGHRRLSIIDLSEDGHQPFGYKDRYVVVYNGEIYNYEDLKKKLILEKKVKTFRGHSDTEVLLEFISVYGVEEALKASIGMFAVGIYDRKTRKLYIGRDRIGEKPLYYGFIDNCFVFASDLGCISEIAKEKIQINHNALTLYFKFGYIPAPYTIYKEIQKLEAGSVIEIVYPFEEIKKYKYWDIMNAAKYGEDHLFEGTEKEAVYNLEKLLKQAIKRQMTADVPVGAFLSGGIDSTTVVAIMQSLSKNKVKTFSIGFEETDYDEAIFAKQSAKFLGTDHTELYVSSKDIVDLIPMMPYIYSEPFADSSQLPTYLVSKLAKEKVTVSLSGDGGDELFCGYWSYDSLEKLWRKIHKIPKGLRKVGKKAIEKLGPIEGSKLSKIGTYIGADSMNELYDLQYSHDFFNQIILEGVIPPYKYTEYPNGFLKRTDIENVMLMDMLMYHPDDILVKVDRSAMAVSLETRVPMLDKDVVEFAFSLPHEYKADEYTRKKILKEVLYHYVPSQIVNRPKKGFSIPVMKWVRDGELTEWAEDMLSDSRIRRQRILNPTIVKKLWNECKEFGKWENYVWYLLMFEEWIEKYGII